LELAGWLACRLGGTGLAGTGLAWAGLGLRGTVSFSVLVVQTHGLSFETSIEQLSGSTYSFAGKKCRANICKIGLLGPSPAGTNKLQ